MIAATVSIVVLAISNIINVVENRKRRNVDVITVQLARNKDAMRASVSRILAFTNPLLFTEPKDTLFFGGKDHDGLWTFNKKELFLACGEFEMQTAGASKRSIDMLNAMRAAVKAFLRCLVQCDETSLQELSARRAQFRQIMTAYDSGAWEYIKVQSDGRKHKNLFGELYRARLARSVGLQDELEDWLD